jgi:hypothetical protein
MERMARSGILRTARRMLAMPFQFAAIAAISGALL